MFAYSVREGSRCLREGGSMLWYVDWGFVLVVLDVVVSAMFKIDLTVGEK